VSRPRERHYHDFSMCGWHYSRFSATAGREVYRWKANELLQAAGISYRLADSSEDLGRLAAVFDDGRSALLAEVLGRTQPTRQPGCTMLLPCPGDGGATDEDKRSALITLAGYPRRTPSAHQEGPGQRRRGRPVQIANKSAIRHHNGQQLSEYDPAFLDWVLWWYLGTVELTDHIISRQEARAPEHGSRVLTVTSRCPDST
jgi:hypothetical protein